MNATRLAACMLLTLAAARAVAAVTQQVYHINPGGQYEYKPSPWVGIPGGSPSDFELDFGIGGTFVYELDTTAKTARLLNLNLTLTGNEAIQMQSPTPGLVNAANIERYLASKLFVEDFIGGLLHLQAEAVPGLKLTDGLNGNIALVGGYDNTPLDGDGVRFQFSASAVPEPSTLSLLAVAPLLLRRRRRLLN